MYIFYHHAAHISIRRTNIGADVSRRRFGAYNICKAESFPPQGPMRRPRRGVSGAVTYAEAPTFAPLQCRAATPPHNIAAAAYARAIYREINLSSIFCRKMNFYVLHIFGVNGLWKSQSFQRRENRGKPMNMRFPKSFQKPFENSVFAFIK